MGLRLEARLAAVERVDEDVVDFERRSGGGGYPESLSGEQIPLEARIVCACDAFNAMVTDRSYRKGRTPEAALAEQQANRDTQFDSAVVDAITYVERTLG
jgi:HD-GYP domain-containing protein (c-di-GMP phosphodiesterase class II)